MSSYEIDVTLETRLGLYNVFHRQPFGRRWWKSISVLAVFDSLPRARPGHCTAYQCAGQEDS